MEIDGADLVEEQQVRERIVELAERISSYRIECDSVYDNHRQGNNYQLQQMLTKLELEVNHLRIVRGRNDEVRREQYRRQQVMLS